MNETVRIKGDSPLDMAELPQVEIPLGEDGAVLVMRIGDMVAVSSVRIPVSVHCVVVEAWVKSETSAPLAMLPRDPSLPDGRLRFSLSFAEAVRAGLFPADRVELVEP